MSDLNHIFGQDLSAGTTGDLLMAPDTELSRQRVLRRLLTNPGDYIFHPDYGAGLAQFVGQVVDVSKAKALIRGQMLLEDAVAQDPEPQVTVIPIQGGMQCDIRYTDSSTGQTVGLSFNVTK